ncbi:MAG: acyltransferase [Bacteroidota bacterium]|nr:acyltransferase [Bacteroidota bacterium]
MNYISSASFSDTKKHYEILDGLRGVAAVMVVMFHLLETFTGGSNLKQIINHGYLAVDFFFVLSGFVIGYAYDNRWDKMTLKGFFKRRLIRLHPMIIAGMVIGAVCFYFQGSAVFPMIRQTPVWEMLLIMLIGFTLLPVPPSMDIRGWQEMHPLDGPAWSLFFEYIANILYALFIRKFSNKLLAVFVFIFGCILIQLSVFGPNGDVIGGWSVEPSQLRIGFTRLLYPFFAGLLLSRICKPGHIKHAFFWCSLLLVIILSVPRIGGSNHLWMNGLYVSFCIIFLFPLIVYLGASGKVVGKLPSKICEFLGNISFPIYIIHYPFIYLFTAWVSNKNISLTQSLPVALIVLLASIALAYVCLKLYDIPVRKWLTKRFMGTPKK